MKRLFLLWCLALPALTACGGGGQSSVPPAGVANGPLLLTRTTTALETASLSCYATTGATSSISATITFYGWPDNTPPGAAIAHPVIHRVAGGDGSYCNPTTFATEPTKSENAKIPYGTRIYVPFLQKYFVREDDCLADGPQGLGCSGVWFDLWIGGDAKSKSGAVIKCEDSLTPSARVTVIVNPPSDEPVAWTGPIYSDTPAPKGSCNVNPAS